MRDSLLPCLFCLLIFTACPYAPAGEWEKLPSLPDKEGFAGQFAGVSQDSLLVAGGANFPDKKPWEGGKKTWTDAVYVLEKPSGTWKHVGKLPRALGYGVSVSDGRGVICTGGSNADGHYAETFRLDWNGRQLITTKLASLPQTLANCCGALVGDTLYVAGGIETPNSTKTSASVWQLDLKAEHPKWEPVENCPGGGRMLAVAASFDNSFWLMGGVDLSTGRDGKAERRYLSDAYRYTSGQGWTKVADLPKAIAATPSPAPSDSEGFYLFGGDDGTQVSVTAEKHRGFSKVVFRYDAKSKKWIVTNELAAPRVTAPVVPWQKLWVVPNGEARPGIRSPEVWAFDSNKLKKKE